ncbi:MAG: tetratricopeptide repeat protein, partial [Pseudomonadota bacterium]
MVLGAMIAILTFAAVGASAASDSPATSLSKPHQLASLNALSHEVLHRQARGDHIGALKLAKTLAARVKTEFGPTHLQYVLALNNVALLHDEQNRPYDAAPIYAEALRIIDRHHPTRVATLAVVLNNL